MALTEYEKLSLALQAMAYKGVDTNTYNNPQEVIEEAKKVAYDCFPHSAPVKAKVEEISEADVEEIYKAYPTRDGKCGNRSTGKIAAKNKEQIRNLLHSGITKEHLLACIDHDVKDTSYLRNFSTFLNGLPDLDESVVVATPKKPTTIWE